MSRPGITYNDVANAAMQLLDQNIRPTVEEVRKVLKTGSHSTINRLLRDWREQQGEGLVPLAASDGIPSSLVTLIKNLYNTLEHEAKHKYETAEAEYRRELEETKTHAQQIETQLGSQLEELSKAHEILKNNHSALDLLSKQQSAEIHAQKQSLSQQSLSLAHMQSQLDDRADYAKKLETECRYAQTNLEHYRETMRIHREEERLHYENLLSDLKRELHELRNSNIDLTKLLKDTDTQLQSVQEQLATSVLNYSVEESKRNEVIKYQANQIVELNHLLQIQKTENFQLLQRIEEVRENEREKYELCLKQRLSEQLSEQLTEQLSEQFKNYQNKIIQIQLNQENKIKQEVL